MVMTAQTRLKVELWQNLPLGEVMTLQRGFDLPHRMRREGDFPIVTSSGREDYHNVPMVSGPGVVTGRYGTIGQVFYIEEDFWPLNTTLYVRDFRGNHSRFCAYLLETIDFKSHSGKSGVPGVNRNDLHQISVAVPPSVHEQQVIAEALLDADALIESLEALIAKKRAIKQGAMQDLLSGRKRLPGFSGEWQKCAFGEIFNFFPTATNSRADLSTEGDFYYVHYGDIHTRFHSHLDFSRQSVPKISRTLCPNAAPLKNGDWIMADASEDFDGVGKSIEVSGLRDEVLAVSGLHTFLLREKIKTFAPGFKGHLGNSTELRRQYLRVMTGMKVYGVSKTALKDLLLPIPEWAEQEAITEILDDLDGELETLEARLSKARQIKQGMMQELLTGRVRLI